MDGKRKEHMFAREKDDGNAKVSILLYLCNTI
jgi:hypothetical protein